MLCGICNGSRSVTTHWPAQVLLWYYSKYYNIIFKNFKSCCTFKWWFRGRYESREIECWSLSKPLASTPVASTAREYDAMTILRSWRRTRTASFPQRPSSSSTAWKRSFIWADVTRKMASHFIRLNIKKATIHIVRHHSLLLRLLPNLFPHSWW